MLCSNSVKPVVHGFKVEAAIFFLGGGGVGGGARKGHCLFCLFYCLVHGTEVSK